MSRHPHDDGFGKCPCFECWPKPCNDCTARIKHVHARCPTCGRSTAGSEGWSTGQCDDCYLTDHEEEP